MQQAGISSVRSGLRARIDALATGEGRDTLSALREQLDRIRRDAHRHGLLPAAQLAATLGEMLAAGTLGWAVASSFDLMRDALECEDNGPESGAVYIAALTSRFGH